MFEDLAVNLLASQLYDFGKNAPGKLKRKAWVRKALRDFHIEPKHNDFAECYAETLVTLKLDHNKEAVSLNAFKDRLIMEAFYGYFYGEKGKRGNTKGFEEQFDLCLRALGAKELYQTPTDFSEARQIDWKAELDLFWKVFEEKINESRTVKEAELRNKLQDLYESHRDSSKALKEFIQWAKDTQKEHLQVDKQSVPLESTQAQQILEQYAHKLFHIQHIGQANFYLGSSPNEQKGQILGEPPFFLEHFLGREEDLKHIHHKLFEEENLLLLVNGEGGIGKTSLAAQYFLRYQDRYSYLAWVFAEQSLLDALLTLSIPLKMDYPPTMGNEERLGLLLNRMRQLQPRPCLLVVDNANLLKDLEQYYPSLRSCPNFHVLLTTRITQFESAPFHRIQALKDAEAKALFTSHYPKLSPEEAALLDTLLPAIGKNTLVIELLAKNLAQFNKLRTHYSLQSLLDDLGSKGLFGLATKEIHTPYQAPQRQLRRESPENILAAMYDLGDLSAAEQQMLAYFSLLPAENIPLDTLEALLPQESDLEGPLFSLFQQGWLDYNPTQLSFKISPVVQEVVQRKISKLVEVGLPLINGLTHRLDYEPGIGHLRHASYKDAVLYAQYADHALRILPRLQKL